MYPTQLKPNEYNPLYVEKNMDQYVRSKMSSESFITPLRVIPQNKDDKMNTLLIRVPKNGKTGIWFAAMDGVQWDSSMDGGEFFKTTNSNDFHLKSSMYENGYCRNEIIIDNTDYTNVVSGLNIVIFDTMTKKVADSIGFNVYNDYEINHWKQYE